MIAAGGRHYKKFSILATPDRWSFNVLRGLEMLPATTVGLIVIRDDRHSYVRAVILVRERFLKLKMLAHFALSNLGLL